MPPTHPHSSAPLTYPLPTRLLIRELKGVRVEEQRQGHAVHDTRGTALVNVYVGLEAGVSTFDASAGGLGGCPYSPGATGNLATEDLVYLLDGLGIRTGTRLDAIAEASRAIEPYVGHPLPSRVFRAMQATTQERG